MTGTLLWAKTGHLIQCLLSSCCRERLISYRTLGHSFTPCLLEGELNVAAPSPKCDINLGKKKNMYLFPHFCFRKNMFWGIKVVEESRTTYNLAVKEKYIWG